MGTLLGLAVSAMETRLLDVETVLLGRKTARERLASLLAARAGCMPASATPGPGRISVKVTLPMARSDIADYLGLTIETVSPRSPVSRPSA